VFIFTMPTVTLLSRTRFFADGHPWSGVSPENLGRSRRSGAGSRSGARGRVTIAERRRQEAEAAAAVEGKDENNQQSVEA
jgi:preprotein translocase subunit SecD